MKKQWSGLVYSWDGESFGELGGAVCSYESGQPLRPANTHLFCTKCGVVWGMVLFPLARHHAITHVPCREHGGGVFDNQWQGKFPCVFDEKVMLNDFLVMYDWLVGVNKCEYDMDCGSLSQAVSVGSRKDWS